MGPWYDHAVIQRTENDEEVQRKLELIRLRQGRGIDRPTFPLAFSGLMLAVLVLQLL